MGLTQFLGLAPPPPPECNLFMIVIGGGKQFEDKLPTLLSGADTIVLTHADIAGEQTPITPEPSGSSFTVEEISRDFGISDEIARIVLTLHSCNYVKVGINTFQLKKEEKLVDLITEIENDFNNREDTDIDTATRERHIRLCKKYSFTSTNTENEADQVAKFITATLKRRVERASQTEPLEMSRREETTRTSLQPQNTNQGQRTRDANEVKDDWLVFIAGMMF